MGTHWGHGAPAPSEKVPRFGLPIGLTAWARLDSNQDPTDYESVVCAEAPPRSCVRPARRDGPRVAHGAREQPLTHRRFQADGAPRLRCSVSTSSPARASAGSPRVRRASGGGSSARGNRVRVHESLRVRPTRSRQPRESRDTVGTHCAHNYRQIPDTERRRRPESNRCKRLCRPLRNHSATSPGAAKRSERVTASDRRDKIAIDGAQAPRCRRRRPRPRRLVSSRCPTSRPDWAALPLPAPRRARAWPSSRPAMPQAAAAERSTTWCEGARG